MANSKYALVDKYSGKKLATFASFRQAKKYACSTPGETRRIVNHCDGLSEDTTPGGLASVVKVAANAATMNIRLHNDAGLIIVDLTHGAPVWSKHSRGFAIITSQKSASPLSARIRSNRPAASTWGESQRPRRRPRSIQK